eukprot:1751094-Amphidinium_carterae.2
MTSTELRLGAPHFWQSSFLQVLFVCLVVFCDVDVKLLAAWPKQWQKQQDKTLKVKVRSANQMPIYSPALGNIYRMNEVPQDDLQSTQNELHQSSHNL